VDPIGGDFDLVAKVVLRVIVELLAADRRPGRQHIAFKSSHLRQPHDGIESLLLCWIVRTVELPESRDREGVIWREGRNS
jgi:hypothetical protein